MTVRRSHAERRAGSDVSVLYLSGYGRSGSTILGKVLGELDRAAYVGEVNFFWSDGILAHRPCGCGALLSECPVWTKVISRLDHDPEEIAATAVDLAAQTTRTRHGIASLTSAGVRHSEQKLTKLAVYLDDLYRAIAQVLDVDLIIDSSKSPMYAQALRRTSLNVETVHLVRDPRATAQSWRNPKKEAIGTVELPTFGMARSAMLWSVTNLLAGRANAQDGPHVRVRYEDLMDAPRQVLTHIGQQLGRDFSQLAISPEGATSIGVSHSIAGNPDRFAVGAIKLSPDNRWRTDISRADRRLVTALTLPTLLSYGYPIRHRVQPPTRGLARRGPRANADHAGAHPDA